MSNGATPPSLGVSLLPAPRAALLLFIAADAEALQAHD